MEIHCPSMLLPAGYFSQALAGYNRLIFAVKTTVYLSFLSFCWRKQIRQIVNHPTSYKALHQPAYIAVAAQYLSGELEFTEIAACHKSPSITTVTIANWSFPYMLPYSILLAKYNNLF